MINHKDGNKLNNNIDNLEWCDNAHNVKEAYELGLYKSTKNCPIKAISKIDNTQYLYKSIRECATELKLNRKTITEILKHNKTNTYDYDFEYYEPVSTIPDECKGVASEISTDAKRKAV